MKNKLRNILEYVIIRIVVRIVSVLNHLKNRNNYSDDIVVMFYRANMGDFLICAGILKDFLNRNPGRKLSVFCRPSGYNIIKETGLFENIYLVRQKSLTDIIKTSLKIKAKELIVLPPNITSGYLDECAVGCIAADEKVSAREGNYFFPDWIKLKFDSYYSRIIKLDSSNTFLERTAELFSKLTEEKYEPLLYDMRSMIVPADNKEQYFVVNIGASIREKCWPLGRFQKTIEYIVSETWLTPVFIGGITEKSKVEEIKQCYNGRFEDLCTKTSLSDLISVIGNAAFYLGNDTGTTHIAVACGIPNISIQTEVFGDNFLDYSKVINCVPKALPITVSAPDNKPCRNCYYLKIDTFTDSCNRCISDKGIWECLDEVKVSDVIEKINESGILDIYKKQKIIPVSDLKYLRKTHEKQKIVFTNGCFDVMHIGHVRCLQAASQMGDILVVGLNSDSSVSKLKGPSRPINEEQDRAEFLAAFSFIDHICIFPEETPVKLLEALRPDVWVKGGDYNAENLPEHDIVEKWGCEISFVPLTDGKSTTQILNKMGNIYHE